MRYAAVLVLVLLASTVMAQELASTTQDNREIIIIPEPDPIFEKPSLVRLLPDMRVYTPEVPLEELEASFDVELIFPELLDKTDICSESCRLEYTFTNTLADVVPVSSIYLKQYDLEGVPMSNNLKNYKSRFLDSDGNQVSRVNPGETITVTIEADKIDNIDMDVVPSLILTKAISPDLKAARVDLDRNAWALWLKGEAPNLGNQTEGWSFNEDSGNAIGRISGFQLKANGGITRNVPGVFGGANKFNGNTGFFNITAANTIMTIPRTSESWR